MNLAEKIPSRLRAVLRACLLVTGLAGVAACSRSAEAPKKIPFYIGTTTGIYASVLDRDSGAFTPARLILQTPGPSFLVASADGRTLYATCETGDGAVVAYRIGRDGALKELNRLPANGSPCHLSLDATGRCLFAANYGGGSIAAFRLNPDGSLAERTTAITLTGSGPDPDNQKGPHAHGLFPSPDNRFVLLCDLGTDEVRVYRLDPVTGALASQPGEPAKVPPGSGPRHLAFDPSGRFVHVVNEMGRSVTTFSWDAAQGLLAPLRTVPSVPEGTPAEGVTGSELAFGPTGKWLYVSNRGHNSLARFADSPDGVLVWQEEIPSEVDFPRHFALDPWGGWLLAAGQKDGRIASFRIDPATGRLTPTGSFLASIPTPTCVLFSKAFRAPRD